MAKEIQFQTGTARGSYVAVSKEDFHARIHEFSEADRNRIVNKLDAALTCLEERRNLGNLADFGGNAGAPCDGAMRRDYEFYALDRVAQARGMTHDEVIAQISKAESAIGILLNPFDKRSTLSRPRSVA